MERETHIVLIRHAATDTDGRLCGSYDVPLSQAGRRQVQTLLERRPIHSIPDALFTSPLRRARDVAIALAHAWAIELRTADWAREIDCGSVDGMPLDTLRREMPEVWARNEAQTDDTFAWPGGETYAEFRDRIVAGLRAAVSAHAGRRVAVVTHAGVVSEVLGVLRGRRASVWSVDRPAPFTATEIVWKDSGPAAVLAFNDPDWY